MAYPETRPSLLKSARESLQTRLQNRQAFFELPIRDDQGHWSQIESYITRHSAAEFSHGLCPECLARAMKINGLENKELS